MSTEYKKNCNDATLQNGVKFDEEVVNKTESMLEEGKLGKGMRKRAGKPPSSALSVTDKALSRTSKLFDIDGDGELDGAEQAMRDMDTENRGFLTNEKVYEVMLGQMKLQQEVFGLKRMSLGLVFVVVLLSVAMLGSSFAAATLAKDTNVVNGSLVAKDGTGVVGTSAVAATFALGESAERRLQDTYVHDDGRIWITRLDAAEVWGKCKLGQSVFLQRSCGDGMLIVDVPICGGAMATLTRNMGNPDEPVYTYAQTSDTSIINCSASPCTVTFPLLTPACNNPNPMSPVILGGAGNYVILTKAGITNTPTAIITGNIGVSPIAAAALTGFGLSLDLGGQFSTSTELPGYQVHAASYGGAIKETLTTAVNAMQTAYTDAAGRTTTDASRNNLGAGTLNEKVLTPGVYTFSTDVGLTGNIHFQGSANDIFIIQIAGTLIQDANFRVILDDTTVGQPKAENIFWQVAGAVTMQAGAHMEGIILAKTAVTMGAGSSLNGRILAQTACTLLKGVEITEPARQE
jgi:hypothetical protein